MALCYHRRLKFIHVPKTGGTTLIRALKLDRTGYHDPWSVYPEDTRDFTSFTIVRDPIARFVSQYNFGMSKRSFWHIQGTKHEFGDYQAMKDMSLLEIADELKKPWKKRSLRHCGWWPQCWFICDKENKIRADFVLRQEYLQSDLTAMLTKLGLADVPLEVMNRSEPILSLDDVLADANLVGKLIEIYRRDYQVLGVQPPLPV
jgi:hypothetical protein